MISVYDPHRGHNLQVENCCLRGMLKMKLIEEWKRVTRCKLLEGRTQEQMRRWNIPLVCKHRPRHCASRLMVCSWAGEILILPWEHRIALMCSSRNMIRGKILSLGYRFCNQNLTKCSEMINGLSIQVLYFLVLAQFSYQLYTTVLLLGFSSLIESLLYPMLKFCRYRH